jgi:TATA-box binding protein (TBP) (component of TFIID and TFIIIB)
VSVTTNITLNYKTIFEHLVLVDYIAVPKKRGRKRKNEEDNVNTHLVDGNVINIMYRDEMRKIHMRGPNLKNTVNCFHNNLCIVIYVGKLLNVKISQNGKFHLTGCQTEEQAFSCIRNLYQQFVDLQKANPEKVIYRLQDGEDFQAIFNNVLINKTFSIGFNIKRRELDKFLNTSKDSDFISVNDPDENYAGIVILLRTKRPENATMPSIRATREARNSNVLRWSNESSTWDKFLSMLPKQHQAKILKKEDEKSHTFLVFWNGKVIMSSPFEYNRKEAFDHFIETLHTHRKAFEKPEVLENPPHSPLPEKIYF